MMVKRLVGCNQRHTVSSGKHGKHRKDLPVAAIIGWRQRHEKCLAEPSAEPFQIIFQRRLTRLTVDKGAIGNESKHHLIPPFHEFRFRQNAASLDRFFFQVASAQKTAKVRPAPPVPGIGEDIRRSIGKDETRARLNPDRIEDLLFSFLLRLGYNFIPVLISLLKLLRLRMRPHDA